MNTNKSLAAVALGLSLFACGVEGEELDATGEEGMLVDNQKCTWEFTIPATAPQAAVIPEPETTHAFEMATAWGAKCTGVALKSAAINTSKRTYNICGSLSDKASADSKANWAKLNVEGSKLFQDGTKVLVTCRNPLQVFAASSAAIRLTKDVPTEVDAFKDPSKWEIVIAKAKYQPKDGVSVHGTGVQVIYQDVTISPHKVTVTSDCKLIKVAENRTTPVAGRRDVELIYKPEVAGENCKFTVTNNNLMDPVELSVAKRAVE